MSLPDLARLSHRGCGRHGGQMADRQGENRRSMWFIVQDFRRSMSAIWPRPSGSPRRARSGKAFIEHIRPGIGSIANFLASKNVQLAGQLGCSLFTLDTRRKCWLLGGTFSGPPAEVITFYMYPERTPLSFDCVRSVHASPCTPSF